MGETLNIRMADTWLVYMETPCYYIAMAGRYITMVNAWPNEKLRRGISPITITGHAIDRCQQRVAAALTRHEVRGLLTTMVSEGRNRTTPRKWTKRSVFPTPGLSFVYWFELPDVCGLVVGRALVTVLTRDSCRMPRLSSRHRSPSGLSKRRKRHIDEERFPREPVEDTI